MTLVVRPATPADRPALLEQSWQLNLYEDPISQDRRIDKPGAEDTLATQLGKVERSGGVALVAERDGAVVGHLFLSFESHPPYVRAEKRDYAYVVEFFVRAEARGSGIGRALLNEAERIAATRGLRQIMIGVLAGNGLAERAYLGYGFRPYATELVKTIGE
jgi:GNAT superfamily N-acetyltransferase